MLTTNTMLLAELRQLIEEPHQHAVAAINAELTLLYRQVGQRIRQDMLSQQHAVQSMATGHKAWKGL